MKSFLVSRQEDQADERIRFSASELIYADSIEEAYTFYTGRLMAKQFLRRERYYQQYQFEWNNEIYLITETGGEMHPRTIYDSFEASQETIE